MELQVGGMLAGHRLIERIGEGHYGEVWRAEYLGQPVALKIFNHNRKIDHAKREAFAQYALGRLAGDEARYFPRVEHIDLDGHPPLMRMEFIEGRPLEEFLGNQALNLETRLGLGEKILVALDVVHRHGFVHGDLSPLNILVTPMADVKLIDVGYGRLFEESADPVVSTSAEDAQTFGVASPFYAAPERFKAAFLEGCGKSADIFSFGKILYRLITGESPFVIKPVSMKFPALGIKWDDFIFKCLEEDPERRFGDAGAALTIYRNLNRHEPAGGEYRAGCPECKHEMNIPGGWAGERFNCHQCGQPIEVLFYDDGSRTASTALVWAAPAPAVPDIEFLEGRAKKFCPACGSSIYVEAKKCRFCGTWVDDCARRVADVRPRAAVARPYVDRSFVMPAVVTFLAYFLFWLPGAVLNWFFLTEARQHQRQTGVEPPGLTPLHLMMWIFVYLPLFGFAALILFAILGAVVAGTVH